MTIRRLRDEVINQIAAGEVIERPLSVVRELVDNSIDAGASVIEVRIEQGGQNLINVRDDGSGLAAEELELAFERHATSKLSEIADLQRINSRGFRGEALAAISSVAKVRMLSRCKEAKLGSQIELTPGVPKSFSQSQAVLGTSVQVADLFFNQPARRKFLKSPKTDEQKIKSFLQQIALVNPHVHFRLWNEERELLNLARRETATQRIVEMYGPAGIELAHQVGPMRVSGVLLHPSLARSDAGGLLTFVNGRLVSDKVLIKAVRDGFEATLKQREYPVGAVIIEINPEFVDINVHPQKSEVCFRSSQATFQAVFQAVRAGLNQHSVPLGFQPQPKNIALASFAPVLSQDGFNFNVSESAEQSSVLQTQELRNAAPVFRFSDLRYVGQLLQCYLVCEHADQFVMVDMHAAHERYNFNQIRNQFQAKSIQSQRLLSPYTLELDQERCALLLEQELFLKDFGFIFEKVDEYNLNVLALPSFLSESKLELFFRELAEEEFSQAFQSKLTQRIDQLAARMACHASIRSGDILSKEGAYALFAELDKSEFNTACPHGRPIVVAFERARVEAWFGRDR